MKSILIIGMGKFGKQLGSKLLELGNDIMIVDKNEQVINELAPVYTNALIGNCTNEGVLRSLGLNNFDICFVTIGEDFQSSLEITSLLKDLGAKYVISKAERDIQAKFLLKNGADEIVYPERDMAIKVAIKCNVDNIFDYIQLNNEYGIYEIQILKSWVGHTLREANVRQKYNINILAIKKGTLLNPALDANYVFKKDDHIMVLGKNNDVFRLTNQTRKN